MRTQETTGSRGQRALLVFPDDPLTEEWILHFITVRVYHVAVLLQPLQRAIDRACAVLSRLQWPPGRQSLHDPPVRSFEVHPQSFIIQSMRGNDMVDSGSQGIREVGLQYTDLPHIGRQLL